jgi:hypothetical protein
MVDGNAEFDKNLAISEVPDRINDPSLPTLTRSDGLAKKLHHFRKVRSRTDSVFRVGSVKPARERDRAEQQQ